MKLTYLLPNNKENPIIIIGDYGILIRLICNQHFQMSVDVDTLALGSPHTLDIRGSDVVTRVPLLVICDAAHANTPVASNQRVACSMKKFSSLSLGAPPRFLSSAHSGEIDKNIVASNKPTLKFHSKTAN